MSYHVVIVDDEKMVLNSLALAFDWSETDFEIIATFQSSVEASNQILLLKPDVVFTDIQMPEMNGLQLMESILERQPQIKFVVISGHEEFSYAKKALKLGAVGYCLKPLEDDEILSILNQIKETLDEEDVYFNSLFNSMLNIPSQDNISSFTNHLLKAKNLPPNITIAASIHDISQELDGYVHYYKLHCEANTYIYLMENNHFLSSTGFCQRIKQMLLRDQIKNFCYMSTTLNEYFFDDIKQILNCVYSYYLLPIDITVRNFEVTYLEPKTDYIDLIIAEASKNKTENVLSLLKNYETLYPTKERTIYGVIRIYNVTVSVLFRLGGNYFDEPIRSPGELVKAFPDIASVFQYLIVFLRNTTISGNNVNMDLIKNDTFRKIIEYINQNYTSPLSFQAICQTYTFNPSYLSQVFKRELGTTFTSYIKDLRINYAKELLAKTNDPISNICAKIGFEQYFYFSKLFKKETNMTPTQYREREQQLLKNSSNEI